MSNDMLLYESQKKSGAVAVVLNFFIPGAGYMYCGNIILGLAAMFITLVVAVVSMGIGMVIMTPILIIDGFLAADRANKQLAARLMMTKAPAAGPKGA